MKFKHQLILASSLCLAPLAVFAANTSTFNAHLACSSQRAGLDFKVTHNQKNMVISKSNGPLERVAKATIARSLSTATPEFKKSYRHGKYQYQIYIKDFNHPNSYDDTITISQERPKVSATYSLNCEKQILTTN